MRTYTTSAQDTRPAYAPGPASPAQIQLISDMAKERGINIAEKFDRPSNWREAKVIINWLKEQPKVAAAPSPAAPAQDPYAGVAPVEEGKKAHRWHYAVKDEVEGTVKFYRVKRGYKAGFWFVDVQASDEYFPIRNLAHKEAILKAIAADPKAALALYGQELGSCGRCGRTLTSEYRQLGIGPVCIDK